MQADRRFFTVPEAGARYFNAGRNRSYELAREGVIPTIRVGHKFVVPVAAMEKKYEAMLAPAPEAA